MHKARIVGAALIVIAVAGVTYAMRPVAVPSEAIAETAARLGGEEGVGQVYTIIPEQSQTLFQLDEVLRGEAIVVEGKTSAIAGQVTVGGGATTLDLGTIAVNARTLETDDAKRNRAMANVILNTDTFEFITFTSDGAISFPGPLVVGVEYAVEIPGTLTIRDITRPVTFAAMVTAADTDTISGTATATVLRSDYNLIIPDLPFIASVGDEVTIVVALVAVRVQ
ncbi:MAG: YceI family protein [bacterium]|nr:YceI family protein [bacterium]